MTNNKLRNVKWVRARARFGVFLFLAMVVQPLAAQDERTRGVIVRERSRSAAAVNPEVDRWAILIGVSRYRLGDQNLGGNQIPNLKNAADDAQALYDFLRNDEMGGFRDVKDGGRMILLKDEDATRANVERALATLKQSKPDDYFVIYIAAHGALVPEPDPRTRTVQEIPYFALHDSDLRDMKNTAVRMDLFRKLVGEIPAKNGLVLSDTCHSAGVQLAGRGLITTTRANTRYLEEMSTIGKGVGFISAADQTELSYEMDNLNHGVFTWCLLEGLRGNADNDSDGLVTFKELKDYLRDTVPELTNNRQHPQYNTTTIEANYLPLAVVPYLDVAKPPNPDSVGTLVIRTPEVDGVELAVDGHPIGKLSRVIERRYRVPAGTRNLAFTSGRVTRTITATVAPGKSKVVEVNLSFSEGDEDALVEPTSQQVSVFLREDKEPSKEARELLQKGVDSFNRQKFDSAIELFNKAIAAMGGAYADALVFRGRSEQSLGKAQAAVASFRAALALRPSDFETEALLAEARFNAGDNVDEIVTQLRALVKRHPNFEFARVVLGDVLFWRGDLMAAELELRRAVKINPKSPPAHMILADLLTYQDSAEKQKEAVDEADRASNLFDEVSRKQVSAARGLKRLSLSHIIFGGGRYVNEPAMAEARHIQAKALTRLVEYNETLPNADSYLDRARTHLAEALKLARGLTDRRRLALVLATSSQNHMLKGDIASAVKEGEEALKVAASLPDLKEFAEAHHTLYAAYQSDQKYAKAVEHLEKYIAITSTQTAAEEKARLQEELTRLKRLRDANRQK
jgi:uncharacterized caspase-like protein/tetratricopeptide (TPR) repeat protein